MPTVRTRQRVQRRADLHRRSLPVALVLRALTLSALLALGGVPVAHAQLASADAAYASERWAEAGRAYEDALASGGLERQAWVRAHVRLARVSLEGAQPTAARRHLEWALAVEPSLEPPPDWPADAAALFTDTRERRRALPEAERMLSASLTVGAPGAPVQIELHGAPAGLVQTITVTGAELSRTIAYGGQPLVLRLPAETAPWFVRALDAAGNVLTTAGVPAASQAIAPETALEPPTPLEPTPAVEPDLVENPWLWVVVGLLAVGIGVVVGLTAFEERTALGVPVLR